MGLRNKKFIVAGAGLTLSASLAWASCGGTEGIVVGQVQGLVQLIAQKMLDGTLAVIQNSILSTDRTVSAIKVVVRQESASSEKKIMAVRGAGEAFATTYSAQRASEQVYDIYNRYRSQGFDPCGTSKLTKDMKLAEIKAGASAVARISTEIDAAPGRYGDPAQTLAARLSEHKSLFCTEAEVAAGVCSSPGVLPGGSSNAALLFQDAAANSVESKAKNAFINSLFGLPTPANQWAGREQTPEAQAAMADKHRKDAINSIAMFSMKTIQSDHEIDPATGKSAAGLLRERVGLYFGTDKSAQWAQSLAAQEQRGVLVDLVKMEGVALKLSERRIMQNARLEGNLAGLLALATDRAGR